MPKLSQRIPHTYHGPDSAIALRVGEQPDAVLELVLRHGAVVDVPPEAEAVVTLVAMGHLVPVATTAAAVTTGAGSDGSAKASAQPSKAKGA